MGGVQSKAEDGADLVVPPRWSYYVLNHCSWRDRALLVQISRGWTLFARQPYHAQWCAQRLAAESMLYIPSVLPPGVNSAAIFASLWAQRNLWSPTESDLARVRTWKMDLEEALRAGCPLEDIAAAAAAEEEEDGTDGSSVKEEEEVAAVSVTPAELCAAFGIDDPTNQLAPGVRVIARFKPPTEAAPGTESAAAAAREFVLPLHQRLQLIRMRPGEDGKNALATLKREGGWSVGASASWKKPPMRRGGDNKENAEGEGGEGCASFQQRAHIQSVDAGTSQVVMVAPIVGMRSFAFDAVAPHRTTQKRAYEIGAKELVMHVINGFNGAG